jgi:aromatic-L-amino-acid/L-tryptophan decarboxylase
LSVEGAAVTSLEWSADEMVRNGEATLRRLVEYLEHIRDRSVVTDTTPLAMDELLGGEPPERGEDFGYILNDTVCRVLPHLGHWNHPRFHGYFSISGSYPGALAELFCAGINVNTMLWQTAPAAVALEGLVLRWIAGMVGYPPDAEGVIVPGASLATFYALAVAREHVVPGCRRAGFAAAAGRRFRIYTSDQAHSSVERAAGALGVGTDNVVRVASDEGYRMSADRLASAIERDTRSGCTPLAVVATVGTTATGAVDPMTEIAAVCRDRELWLHVDAAYGGLWSLLPEIGDQVGAFTAADSLVVNPHKCLFAAIGSSCLYCRESGSLSGAFRLVPEYLHTSTGELELDYMDRTLQLGRGFKALPLWWIVRSYGLGRIREHFRTMIRLARWLEARLDEHPAFMRPARSIYPLVTLRFVPSSDRVPATQPRNWAVAGTHACEQNVVFREKVNASGKAFVTQAHLRDGVAIRVSLGNIRTSRDDVRELWRTFERVARDLDRDHERGSHDGAR